MTETPPAVALRSPLRRALRPALGLVGLALVFGWLLPQFIDYQEVWDALAELDGRVVAVLLWLGSLQFPLRR